MRLTSEAVCGSYYWLVTYSLETWTLSLMLSKCAQLVCVWETRKGNSEIHECKKTRWSLSLGSLLSPFPQGLKLVPCRARYPATFMRYIHQLCMATWDHRAHALQGELTDIRRRLIKKKGAIESVLDHAQALFLTFSEVYQSVHSLEETQLPQTAS